MAVNSKRGEDHAEAQVDPLDELFYRRPVRTHVKEFGFLFSIICLLISGWLFYRGGSFPTALSIVFLGVLLSLLGIWFPRVLHPVWKAWMTFAHALGIVMTAVILTVAWGLLVIPISVLLRILRIKVMNQDFRAPVDTYWEEIDKSKNDFKRLEKQY